MVAVWIGQLFRNHKQCFDDSGVTLPLRAPDMAGNALWNVDRWQAEAGGP